MEDVWVWKTQTFILLRFENLLWLHRLPVCSYYFWKNLIILYSRWYTIGCTPLLVKNKTQKFRFFDFQSFDIFFWYYRKSAAGTHILLPQFAKMIEVSLKSVNFPKSCSIFTKNRIFHLPKKYSKWLYFLKMSKFLEK